MKDFSTQMVEEYTGLYQDLNGNFYELYCYCGYWYLYLYVGENGHTKTIVDNSDLGTCLGKVSELGLVKRK